VLVQATDLYGWGIGDATASALERQGRALVARIPLGGLPCGDGQVPALLRVLLRAGPPDVVILAGHGAESECAVRAFGPRTRYIVTDGLGATPWPGAARGLDLWAVTFWDRESTTEVSRDFRARFERLAGHAPTGEQALIYDAILAMGHAALAQGPDRKRVRDYLATLGAERPEIQGVTGGIALRGVRGDRLVLEHWVDGTAAREAPW
jgi:ABC-type branched-subunit amino acid transport system substrate-binding protein